MDGLYWKTLLKLMIWGYPYFWKHPHGVWILMDFEAFLGMVPEEFLFEKNESFSG